MWKIKLASGSKYFVDIWYFFARLKCFFKQPAFNGRLMIARIPFVGVICSHLNYDFRHHLKNSPHSFSATRAIII